MKIKTKITLSIATLLAIITLLSYFAIQTTERMKRNTENILADNYNSVKYAQKMFWALYHFDSDSLAAVTTFVENMALQNNNITENSEKQMTALLEKQFDNYKSNPSKENLLTISQTINTIILLNGNAIEKKSEAATYTARYALTWVIILSGLSIIIAIFMLIRLPNTLTYPVQKLVKGIIEISNHNYEQRLSFDDRSEYGEVASSFNNMAHELAQFQQSSMARIIATKQYLEIVINAIEEPIIGLDNQKNILFVNNITGTLLNILPEKMINRSALELSLSNDLLRRLLKGLEEEVNSEPLKIYSDNKECYFEVDYLPLPEQSGMVIMLNNITKFKALDNAKTNYISFIAHELKTPVSDILMSLQLLEDKNIGKITEEQTVLTQSIRQNGDILLSISEGLLRMAQVEAGNLQFSLTPVAPVTLIENAMRTTSILADKFKCTMEAEYPEKINTIVVDAEKTTWVITNLLSFAIYSSYQNAKVLVGGRQVGETVEIYIKNFGKGIDPRYHKHIFDRYFRIPDCKMQGCGLELALSKEFVETQGGTLHLESEVGQGSCFILSFKTTTT